MTSRGIKTRACIGKRAHQRQRDATAHLRRLVSGGALSHRLCTYHCRHCGAWHVGHWNQRGRHR
jgi:hypothetical protein